MEKTDDYFETLCNIFNVSNENKHEWDEQFETIYKELGIHLLVDTNPMEIVLNHIYTTDNIGLLERMLLTEDSVDAGTNFSFDNDMDFAFTEFEIGDWSDFPDTEYGLEGYNYYVIHTENFMHTFSHMMPFREFLSLQKSEKKKGLA
tara:strand:- start:29 stop:469 length:441 start_codon:yes stop_codon:yes gene_type:complete